MNEDALAHAQHLLRHIDDPLALEGNPLIMELSVGAVRKMLEHLCAAMENAAHRHANDSSIVRRYEIFRRCDLAGESHSAVASEIGLSRRQFYRERRIIARQVADLFSPLAINPAVLDLLEESDLAALLHAIPDVPSPFEAEVWLRRLVLETRYSDLLLQSGSEAESRNLDAVIGRRLSAARGHGVGVELMQYAGIHLVRRELGRGNVRTAMVVLDVLEATLGLSSSDRSSGILSRSAQIGL